MAAVDAARERAKTQTVQEQVADRAAVPLCRSCHASFDSYGLVLDYYDNIGIYRTTDDIGMPVDAHTMLPAELGGAPVASAVDLAQKLSESPAFTNCMATSVLQYAMTTIDAHVDLPINPTQSGCAGRRRGDEVQRQRGQVVHRPRQRGHQRARVRCSQAGAVAPMPSIHFGT